MFWYQWSKMWEVHESFTSYIALFYDLPFQSLLLNFKILKSTQIVAFFAHLHLAQFLKCQQEVYGPCTTISLLQFEF